VLVEPGTRRGFDVIIEAREQLISLGAAIVAPCPHEQACPMKVARDWCHFSARVERTAEHRRLKQGELGHEDEKFSYVAATRLEPERAKSRIVRHPQRFSGFTKLQLCATEGLQQVTVTRSQKEKFRAVKRAEWGSEWND
jgi:ribosomal protein RSM22 (predicted rRNA methylase)